MLTPSLITQGEELLKKASREPWSFERNVRMETYNIESAVPSEYVVWKGYESDGGCCFKEDAEFICWARNHASELLQAAREMQLMKDMMQFDVEGRLLANCPTCNKGYKAPNIAIIS